MFSFFWTIQMSFDINTAKPISKAQRWVNSESPQASFLFSHASLAEVPWALPHWYVAVSTSQILKPVVWHHASLSFFLSLQGTWSWWSVPWWAPLGSSSSLMGFSGDPFQGSFFLGHMLLMQGFFPLLFCLLSLLGLFALPFIYFLNSFAWVLSEPLAFWFPQGRHSGPWIGLSYGNFWVSTISMLALCTV